MSASPQQSPRDDTEDQPLTATTTASSKRERSPEKEPGAKRVKDTNGDSKKMDTDVHMKDA